MNSERIKELADEISLNDTVLDVGCDHGYLSIYLKQNNLCKEVYASDISENALEQAKKNFKKYKLDIKSFVSDGFQNIPVEFDTAVIAGMGTSTILNILNSDKKPRKLVLASNNEHYKLRSNLNKMGYKIVDEKIVLENDHYYVILLCIKAEQKLSKKYLKFGISNDEDYYRYLLNKNKELIKKVNFSKKVKLWKECLELKYLIERK